MKKLVAIVLASALLSCEKPSARKPARGPRPPASASAALSQISSDFWSELGRHSPLWATSVGDRSHDAELDDPSSKEAQRHVDALFALLTRLDSVDAKSLAPSERVTVEALRETLAARIEAANACKPHLWQVDPIYGYQVTLAQLPTHQSIETKEDADELAKRYRGAKALFEAYVATLREGMASGRVAPKVIVERLIAQLDASLAVPAAESPHAKAKLPHELPGWYMEEVVRIRKHLVKSVEDGVYPGLTIYRDFLKNELLPRSRIEPGVDRIAGGAECYRAMIRLETGGTRTPQELHELGLAQVASLETEMLAIAKASGAPDLAAYGALAAKKPGAFYESRDAIVDHNKAQIAKAAAALPKAFRAIPETPLEVRPVESFREKDASRGQYHHAPGDHSRPAIYFVNTLDPETQRKDATAALAAHEALPGHHLQIALAKENPSLPRFQRDLPPTVYVEGWGLYAERLADDLGLYATPEERFGMLDAQRLRAVRLVLDTGLHALGWSREKAVEYQVAHGTITAKQAERAVDRYITWPGQALAYMSGNLEFQAMRADAEKALGKKFDLRDFHDRVLRHGGVPLPVVRREVDAWIAATK